MTGSKKAIAVVVAATFISTGVCAAFAEETVVPKDPKQSLERTSFQTGGPYDPRVDIGADVAMVYGITNDFAGRMRGWREHGYIIHLMTGVAWGSYQDYFEGRWDGKSHQDEAQTDRNGNPVLHNPGVPYVAPSDTYGKYLCGGVQKAIDAGAEAIHLEEPEFWVHSGYSNSFQREWEAYYHEPWQAQHTSPDAQYRSSKLKHYLYRRALQQVFEFVDQYGSKIGRKVRCYVPTHSLLNYSHWRIVSPEQSLVQLKGCDGYIGQVWTGTARTPNVYQGILKERTFETAFFEYGVLQNLVRSTGRRMWYLNDPVEDNPDHGWDDYRRNWECTLVASLLWPDVSRYEVAPWPERPFIGEYPASEAGPRNQRVRIPSDYATELLTVFHALGDMDQKQIAWDCGPRGLGILVSDTLMYQRGEPNPSNPHLGSFYGLGLPLLKRGMPAEPVQMENIGLSGYLKPYRVLFLTYEGMKPPTPELHDYLAEWVKSGGVLVFVDDDTDPYNSVREWWNTGERHYATPRQHLFERLGLANATEGLHKVGKGALLYRKWSPAGLTASIDGDANVREAAREACAAAGIPWRETPYLVLHRGPYIVAAGLDESPATGTKELQGQFVDLFSANLSVLTSVSIEPGTRRFLVDLAKVARSRPAVIASASRVLGEKVANGKLRFISTGPTDTICATRIALLSKPRSVLLDGAAAPKIAWAWDAGSRTLLLRHSNRPGGVSVEVGF